MTDPIALTASLIFMFVAGFVVGYAVRAAISRRRRARAR
jgi:cell division protein FtsX